MRLLSLLLTLLSVLFAASASPCPEEIRAHISYGTNKIHPKLPDIYEILTNCPNVTSLDLKIEQGGCVLNDDPRDPWSFGFSPGDKFPPLRKLRLDGYLFQDCYPKSWHKTSHRGNLWYRAQAYIAWWTGLQILLPFDPLEIEPPPPSNLDRWKAAMDWTHLEQLEIAHVTRLFLETMTGQLPSLKSLTLGMDWWVEQDPIAKGVSEFVAESPSLSVLSLHSFTNLLNWTEVLSKHGNDLRSLTIREWESEDPYNPRPVLSLPQLQNINATCPFLQELDLDIYRDGTWPFETLEALATFERMQRLSLRFDLGIDQHSYDNDWDVSERDIDDKGDGYRHPRLNSSSALSLFEYLRSEKQGARLQQVMLYVGDWRRDYGGGLRVMGWGDDRAEKYECNVLDVDGRPKPEGMASCTRYAELISAGE